MDDNHLDVLVIGAGFAGVCAGKRLLDIGITNFKIFDKSDAIGGTWYHNRYPGAACDVKSHFYCYSFNPNPNWSKIYSPQPEILTYIQSTAQKYAVDKHVVLNRMIERLVWDDKTALWTAIFSDGTQEKARHVINGMGGLHVPKFPDIEGYDRFDGPWMHSAKWDQDVDFTDKTVAMVGSAASAIQIIPELAKVCKRIKIFQRTPNYISPRNDRLYSEKEKARFSKHPLWAKFYRWLIYKRLEWEVYPILAQTSPLSKTVSKRIVRWMKKEISDPDKQAAMTPKYRLGCKRILVSDTFYKTLAQDHVDLITEAIKNVEAEGVRTQDGTLHTADIIVYATGYDLQAHMRSIDIIGRNGVSLAALGPDGEEAYRGAAHPDFPNYYMMSGPNTGVGSTSVVFMLEVQMDYIVKLLQAAGEDKTVRVKESALRAFNDDIQKQLAGTVWASGCDSWYLRDDGKIVVLYPGNAKSFAQDHKSVAWADYELTDIKA